MSRVLEDLSTITREGEPSKYILNKRPQRQKKNTTTTKGASQLITRWRGVATSTKMKRLFGEVKRTQVCSLSRRISLASDPIVQGQRHKQGDGWRGKMTTCPKTNSSRTIAS
ncbi:hypothetical protein NPIL_455491 [Nephila pilipes]|uniref:Uncharacterized protein n=1 Tax=Nephila pilipes TaxID=299642 RepID=A0A8X6MCI3_NEPPI|nr:hypothetical protein NPIL_455491 [Nephila pilipes]